MTEQASTEKKHSLSAVGFPCASCGSQTVYDPASGELLCPYCRSITDIKEKEIEAPEYIFCPDTDTYDAPNWDDEGMQTLSCTSCGADIVQSTASVTSKCPFCGSAYVTEYTGDHTIISPETMIPFRVTRETAADSYARWAKKRFCAPSSFKKNATAENLTGVYLPYFTFDQDMTTEFSGQGGRDRVVYYTVRENGKTVTRSRVVTDWFPYFGVHHMSFDDAPVCASRKIDRELLSRVGSFSLKVLSVYDPAYLAGFVAERYDISLKSSYETANATFEARVEQDIRRRGRYDHYRFMRYDHHADRIKFKHILLPVWNGVCHYGKKVYPFVVNGETGQAAGRAPVSPFRVLLAVLGSCAAIALLTFLFYYFG